jgi:hypothetical protein
MRAAWLLLLVACDDPGASIEVVDARVSRQPDKRVVVEADLVGHEGLGKNVGIYCTRVTFPGQAQPVEECRADLEDGAIKTVRFVSDNDIDPLQNIVMRVRLDARDVMRTLAAPPR